MVDTLSPLGPWPLHRSNPVRHPARHRKLSNVVIHANAIGFSRGGQQVALLPSRLECPHDFHCHELSCCVTSAASIGFVAQFVPAAALNLTSDASFSTNDNFILEIKKPLIIDATSSENLTILLTEK
jgi:hypothetical protein